MGKILDLFYYIFIWVLLPIIFGLPIVMSILPAGILNSWLDLYRVFPNVFFGYFLYFAIFYIFGITPLLIYLVFFKYFIKNEVIRILIFVILIILIWGVGWHVRPLLHSY